jgi:hypothetical protein
MRKSFLVTPIFTPAFEMILFPTKVASPKKKWLEIQFYTSRQYASVQKQCKFMLIRVAAPSPRAADDVYISIGHIRGQGASFGWLLHVKHHRTSHAMVVHRTRRT